MIFFLSYRLLFGYPSAIVVSGAFYCQLSVAIARSPVRPVGVSRLSPYYRAASLSLHACSALYDPLSASARPRPPPALHPTHPLRSSPDERTPLLLDGWVNNPLPEWSPAAAESTGFRELHASADAGSNRPSKGYYIASAIRSPRWVPAQHSARRHNSPYKKGG